MTQCHRCNIILPVLKALWNITVYNIRFLVLLVLAWIQWRIRLLIQRKSWNFRDSIVLDTIVGFPYHVTDRIPSLLYFCRYSSISCSLLDLLSACIVSRAVREASTFWNVGLNFFSNFKTLSLGKNLKMTHCAQLCFIIRIFIESVILISPLQIIFTTNRLPPLARLLPPSPSRRFYFTSSPLTLDYALSPTTTITYYSENYVNNIFHDYKIPTASLLSPAFCLLLLPAARILQQQQHTQAKMRTIRIP